MNDFNAQQQPTADNGSGFLDDVKNDNKKTVSCSTLQDLPDPTREEDNPNALFQGGYLRKGGGMFIVSTSGTGKSVLTIQAALCWSVGVEAFGLKPVRPLQIAIIQAEDDETEMADFRNQISRGLLEGEILTQEEITLARESVILADFVGLVGGYFVKRFDSFLKSYPNLDLVILNPLQSYFGGNLQQNSEISAFFRAGLDPIIKGRVGLAIVHHTNKPPNKSERDGWGTDQFSAYIGAGGAELVNWGRAVLLLMPTDAQGVFALVAGKRGRRLGWQTPDGQPTTKRYIAHSKNYIFWRGATEDEAQAAGTTKDKTFDREAQTKKQAEWLADHVRKAAMALTDVREVARQRFGKGGGDRTYNHLLEHLKDFQLFEAHGKHKNKCFLGTTADAEAAARNWDIQNTKKH